MNSLFANKYLAKCTWFHEGKKHSLETTVRYYEENCNDCTDISDKTRFIRCTLMQLFSTGHESQVAMDVDMAHITSLKVFGNFNFSIRD